MHRLRSGHPVLLWLFVTSLLLRGALPAGTMLAGAERGIEGIALVLCSGGKASARHAPDAAEHQVTDSEHRCPYAASAAPGLPVQAAAIALAHGYSGPTTAAQTSAVVTPPAWSPPARGPPSIG